MKVTTILVVEDENAIRDMIQFVLAPTGFEIQEASNVKEAELKIASCIPDLILLDWMLPDISGIDFTQKLKRNPSTQNIPIIMLTAKAEEENKIKGLETGADDYITKPFSPRELIARIKALLRRGPLVSPDGIIKINKMHLNVDTHVLTINNEVISLSPIEYKLLHFFITHQERIYNRSQLLDHVWGGEKDIDERTVDVHVRRLRSRLKSYGYDVCIKTIRGSGYQFSGNAL